MSDKYPHILQLKADRSLLLNLVNLIVKDVDKCQTLQTLEASQVLETWRFDCPHEDN